MTREGEAAEHRAWELDPAGFAATVSGRPYGLAPDAPWARASTQRHLSILPDSAACLIAWTTRSRRSPRLLGVRPHARRRPAAFGGGAWPTRRLKATYIVDY